MGFFRGLTTSGLTDLVCQPEKFLSEFNIQRRPDARDSTTDARCDFSLENPTTHRVIFADVLVTQPGFHTRASYETSLAAAAQGVDTKRKRYCDNYLVDGADIKPIVVETMGGMAVETFEFLREVVKTISLGNPALFARLWRELRSRIAVAVAKGHAEVILYLNSRDRHRFGEISRGGGDTVGSLGG